MRLWTIQQIGAWERAQEKGVLRADGRRVFREFRQPYQWLIGQMQTRLPDYRGDYPIWAWFQYKPDLRRQAHLPPGSQGVRIEFVAPTEDILISDFSAWDDVLSGCYCSINEEDQRAFDKELKAVRDNPDLLAALWPKIEQSWQRIFDIEFLYADKDWRGEEPILQATLGKISLDQVLKVDHFVAR